MGDHSWSDGLEALTITFVRGPDPREAAEVFRLQESTERQATFDEAWDSWEWGDVAEFPVMVGERDGWSVFVEPNGWGGAQDGIIGPLSRGGTAVSVFWNVNSVMQFVLARDGEVVRSFDPLSPESGPGPYGDPLPEEAGLPFGDEDAGPRYLALELLERVTGVELDADWLVESRWRTSTTDAATWLPVPPTGPDDDLDAATVTIVRGLSLREVADELALEEGTRRRLTFADAEELQDPRVAANPVQLAEVGGSVVVVEPNGFLSADHDTLAALSRMGDAVSVFWNVNAHMAFTAARTGAVVRSFDPLFVPVDDETDGDRLPEEEGLPFGGEDADPQALALELARRLTGVHIEPGWLRETARDTWLTAGADRSAGAVLRLARPLEDRLLPLTVRVEVDGSEVAALQRGDTAVVPLPAGPHTVRARARWSGGEDLDVEVGDDDVVRVLVGSRGGAMMQRV